ncbi:MAG: transpeptidase family protein [Bacteroidetes bacterium]|nr:transpeptidase family protein [Bacteroidota bacterium]MBP9789822.1 transpeptidase family protein [Bacteroidia bacterium]
MWRINISFIVMCLMGLVILVQIFRIQFVQGSYWISQADSFSTRYNKVDASRGNIFSCDGRLLSTSIPIYDIRMDLRADGLSDEKFNANIDSLAICLSTLFKDHTASEYKTSLRQARAANERFYLVRRNVRYAELQTLKQFPLFRLGRYKGGLMVLQKEVREMPFKMLASRTIGTMRDVKPVGIESAFNSELKGVGGRRLEQRISGGMWKPLNDKDEIESKDGHDIITTIDINIQDVAENSLEEHLIKHNADHGCAVLMEVATGEIKAIANLKRNSEGNYVEDFNYVIAEATEPGSTFKMASMLAALDDGFIEPEDTIFVGNGERKYGPQRMVDAHPPHFPKLSIQQAFETSSNVGISSVIVSRYSKNPQAFIDKIKSFGLGSPLGLDIEGEGTPRIKNITAKDWSSVVSLPWMSIGYETKLTPLQILAFYNAIANNGTMVRPHFVKEIQSHGRTLKSFDTEIIRDSIASPAALAKARQLMEGVVERGSAKQLNSSPYRIAGKTGTAQISMNKFGYDKTHPSYQASFVGYFPADEPKYSCMVVVYAPSKDVFFGGAVAAPIFKDIADKVYSNHVELHDKPIEVDTTVSLIPFAKAGQQKDLKKVLARLDIASSTKDLDAHFVSPVVVSDRIVMTERKTSAGITPNVSGMGVKDAVYILENAGYRVKINGRGNVVRQSISTGTKITKGQLIILDLDI